MKALLKGAILSVCIVGSAQAVNAQLGGLIDRARKAADEAKEVMKSAPEQPKGTPPGTTGAPVSIPQGTGPIAASDPAILEALKALQGGNTWLSSEGTCQAQLNGGGTREAKCKPMVTFDGQTGRFLFSGQPMPESDYALVLEGNRLVPFRDPARAGFEKKDGGVTVTPSSIQGRLATSASGRTVTLTFQGVISAPERERVMGGAKQSGASVPAPSAVTSGAEPAVVAAQQELLHTACARGNWALMDCPCMVSSYPSYRQERLAEAIRMDRRKDTEEFRANYFTDSGLAHTRLPDGLWAQIAGRDPRAQNDPSNKDQFSGIVLALRPKCASASGAAQKAKSFQAQCLSDPNAPVVGGRSREQLCSCAGARYEKTLLANPAMKEADLQTDAYGACLMR